jgi:hypothetical protein
MDTDVRTPIPTLPESKSTSRRRRSWFLVGFAILVVATLVAGLVWLANLEPLARGSFGYDPTSGLPQPMAATAQVGDVDAFGVEGSVLTVRAQPGATFTYAVSIQNDGPVPITIRGVSHSNDLLRLVGMVPDLLATERGSGQMRPFEPFSLQSGGEAALEFEVLVPRGMCLVRNSTTSWYEQTIIFTIFGIERRQSVDAGLQVELLGTKATEC